MEDLTKLLWGVGIIAAVVAVLWLFRVVAWIAAVGNQLLARMELETRIRRDEHEARLAASRPRDANDD